MNRLAIQTMAAVLLAYPAFAVEAVHAVHGTITKIDSGAKTVVVKSAEGTAHTFRWVGETSVHGAKAGASDTFHGLKEGTDVVVHYTGEGAKKTAVEVDRVGDDGFKVVRGPVSKIDHGAEFLAVKTADGTEETFKLAGHAATDSAKGVATGTKVTVYYIADGGKKVAHFFEKH